ncbi:lactate dehydrogenase [Ihubacter sp. mB4P-1]|uniref:lactate dehydrogenase n=1 Tax=Ihubacter sp. mB4P-1 TaxID=3242370 RepID=UPI00137AE5B8
MRRIEDLCKEEGILRPLPLSECPVHLGERNRVNLLALGDVGMTVLIGLRLLGSDVISSIGICDIYEPNMDRLEQELNQVRYPFGIETLPSVEPVQTEALFDCDLLIFCASKGVPPIGSGGDVRMAQLAANRELAAHYGRMAGKAGYKGMVAMVSDPVDPLCKAFLDASGLLPSQIQGYGLGVMNARALYYAEKDSRFFRYRAEGRAYGPHGEDLVIADSIVDYDDSVSEELTKLTVEANMRVREMGFKPYIAPALSSAAISILLTLRGQWHYSSIYLGDQKRGAFLGIKNRMMPDGPVYEDLPLPELLFERIRQAYHNLCELG